MALHLLKLIDIAPHNVAPEVDSPEANIYGPVLQ